MVSRYLVVATASAAGLGLACLANIAPAHADRVTHSTAVFSGLDKITGRIIAFDVAIDETVQFGSLQITPKICYTRPATEAPQTDGFVEVDEATTTNEFKRIFSGWMFSASPGLHGIEHPVYDVWLTDCKGPGQVIATAPDLPQNDDDLAGKGTPAARAAGAKPGAPRAGTAQPRQGLPPANQQGLGAPPQANQGFSNAPVEVGPPPGARGNTAQFNQPQYSQQPSNAPGGLLPPGSIPNAPPQPRRQPTQQFFPTTVQPGAFDRNAPGAN